METRCRARTVTADKALLRSLLRRRRRAVHAANPAAGQTLADAFMAAGAPLPDLAASYLAQGSEIDPEALATRLAAAGVRIALPCVVARDAPLVFRLRGEQPLERDAAGLPAPPPQQPAVRPDLIFAPLLGFDRTGARLGQGGGYYDRTLAALRASGPGVRAIGLAFAAQEVARLPADGFDQRLDGVLTETAYLDFTGDA